MRTRAREAVFTYIFSKLFNPGDEGLFDVLCGELNAKDKSFASFILDNINKNWEKYSEKITALAENFREERILCADKCAIMIGFCELDYCLDTDVPIIIDEAVKLAVKFSTEKSADFVNGILAQYAKEVDRGCNI